MKKYFAFLIVLLISSVSFSQIQQYSANGSIGQIGTLPLQDQLVDSACLFRTQTPGGWGAPGRGNNPGKYLSFHFQSAFPNGVSVGCNNGYTLTLTSSQAVTSFLPSGGRPESLTASLVDPVGYKNTLSGHLVALALTLGFDQSSSNFGISTNNLADAVIASGIFAGWTVQQVFDEANAVFGGCSSLHTPSEMVNVLSAINESFVGGVPIHPEVFVCGQDPCSDLHLNFFADTVCYGQVTHLINLSTGVDSGAVYFFDIFSDDSVDIVMNAADFPVDSFFMIQLESVTPVSIVVVNSNGCTDTFSSQLIVVPLDSCVDIEGGFVFGEKREKEEVSVTDGENFTIFPNPSNGNIFVQITSGRDVFAKVELFGIDGKRTAELFNGNLKEAESKTILLQANSLLPGIYVCRLTTPGGSQMIKLVVTE